MWRGKDVPKVTSTKEGEHSENPLFQDDPSQKLEGRGGEGQEGGPGGTRGGKRPHARRAHSGASQLGFSCPRQCRCAASSLDSTEPHSGHCTPIFSGFAVQDVAMWRWASCTRENVLVQ